MFTYFYIFLHIFRSLLLTISAVLTIFTYVNNKSRGNNMINNTALYNLANYEILHAEWDKAVNECKNLCLSVLDFTTNFIEAEFKKIESGKGTAYTETEKWNDEFDRVHRENWVTPVLTFNNEMFSKSHNPNVNHLAEAGMNGLRAYLTIPPEDDQDKLEILEYIERMQSIMANYTVAMNDLKKRMEIVLKNI